MNADGSNPTRLTDSAAVDVEPDWQPLVAPPANTCGEVYGRGATRENPTARFDLRARYKTGAPSPEGESSYDDPSAGLSFDSTVTDSKPDALAIALSEGYSSRGDLDRGRIARRRC